MLPSDSHPEVLPATSHERDARRVGVAGDREDVLGAVHRAARRGLASAATDEAGPGLGVLAHIDVEPGDAGLRVPTAPRQVELRRRTSGEAATHVGPALVQDRPRSSLVLVEHRPGQRAAAVAGAEDLRHLVVAGADLPVAVVVVGGGDHDVRVAVVAGDGRRGARRPRVRHRHVGFERAVLTAEHLEVGLGERDDVLHAVAVDVTDRHPAADAERLTRPEVSVAPRLPARAVGPDVVDAAVGGLLRDVPATVAVEVGDRGRRHGGVGHRDGPARQVVPEPVDREQLLAAVRPVEAGAHHDVEATVAVQVDHRRARPHDLVRQPAGEPGRDRAVVVEHPDVATGREVERREVRRVALVHVGPDDDLGATVAVEVRDGGRRPRRVVDEVREQLGSVVPVHGHALAPRRDRDVELAVEVDVTDRRTGEDPAGRREGEERLPVALPAVDPAGDARDDDVLHAVAVPVDERRRRLHRATAVVETADHLRTRQAPDPGAAVHAAHHDLGDAVAGDVPHRRRREGVPRPDARVVADVGGVAGADRGQRDAGRARRPGRVEQRDESRHRGDDREDGEQHTTRKGHGDDLQCRQ